MIKNIHPIMILLIAAALEAGGDAIIRKGLYDHAGLMRLGLFVAGAAVLFAYGTLLNLAPVDFGQVVGLYVATLFVVWQAVNFIAFRAPPTLPIIAGGALIVAGGLVVTFWKPA